MIVGAPQESEAVGENFQRAFAEHQPVHRGAFFEDLENQILLLQTIDLGKLLFLHRHPLEFRDVNITAFDLFVPLVRSEVGLFADGP